MEINWVEVIASICAIIVTGVFVPFVKSIIANEKATLSKSTQDTIDYWVEVGVRWAKQWLQSETGEKKKAEVLQFVTDKMSELKISVTADELSVIIEAVYEQVKIEPAAVVEDTAVLPETETKKKTAKKTTAKSDTKSDAK